MSQKLGGILAAVSTPFAADGTVDEAPCAATSISSSTTACTAWFPVAAPASSPP